MYEDDHEFLGYLDNFTQLSKKKFLCPFCNTVKTNLRLHLKSEHNLSYKESLLLFNNISTEDLPKCTVCKINPCEIASPHKNRSIQNSGMIHRNCSNKSCKNKIKSYKQNLKMTSIITESGKTAWDNKIDTMLATTSNTLHCIDGKMISSRKLQVKRRVEGLKSKVNYQGESITKGSAAARKAISTKKNGGNWDEVLETLRNASAGGVRYFKNTKLKYYSSYEKAWLRAYESRINHPIEEVVQKWINGHNKRLS